MDNTIVPEYLKQIQLKDQFYPSESMETLIRREWANDEVSHLTQSLIHDEEGTWDEDEEVVDIFEDSSISMQDKYDTLDNWNEYVGHDSNERFEHEEYMRFGGHFQYVSFRIRQSDENKEKAREEKARRVLKRKHANRNLQQSFDFAS